MPDEMYWDEIPWRLDAVPQRSPIPDHDPSTPDLLGMMTADVLALETHLESVTADLAMYRELVQQALDRIVSLTAQLKAKDARILDQTRQLRELMDVSR